MECVHEFGLTSSSSKEQRNNFCHSMPAYSLSPFCVCVVHSPKSTVLLIVCDHMAQRPELTLEQTMDTVHCHSKSRSALLFFGLAFSLSQRQTASEREQSAS